MAPFGEWPGLPMVHFDTMSTGMTYGVNWVAYTTPMLLSLVYNKGRSTDIEDNLTPALLIWKMFEETRWLLFDEEEPELFGRVLVVVEPDSPSFYPTKKVYLSYATYPFEIITFPDWIAYVKHRWDRDVNREPVKRMVAGPIKIPRPVLYEFSSLDSEELPSLPWVQRHDPRFHSDIVGFDDIFNRASYR